MPYYSPRPPRGSPQLHTAYGIAVPPKGDINMDDYRANSLNQPCRFRDILKTGKVIVGTSIAIPSVAIAKHTATMGFDWCFIDAEHTPMGPDLLTDIIKTINYYSEGSMASVVRLPTHGHEWIAWALDAGAAAIVLPHTETAEEARHVVNAARFSPYGDRSYPPFCQNYGYTDGVPEGSSLLNMWSTNAAIIMQIESAEGAKNAERICCVEGVDAIMIGTGDLRLSMRLPFGFDGPEPEFQEAVKNIEEAAARHNLPLAGFALGPPAVKAKLKKGYKLLMVSNDMTSLTAGQSANLAAARSAVTDSKKVEEKKSFVGKAENVIVAKVAARAMAGQ